MSHTTGKRERQEARLESCRLQHTFCFVQYEKCICIFLATFFFIIYNFNFELLLIKIFIFRYFFYEWLNNSKCSLLFGCITMSVQFYFVLIYFGTKTDSMATGGCSSKKFTAWVWLWDSVGVAVVFRCEHRVCGVYRRHSSTLTYILLTKKRWKKHFFLHYRTTIFNEWYLWFF